MSNPLSTILLPALAVCLAALLAVANAHVERSAHEARAPFAALSLRAAAD